MTAILSDINSIIMPLDTDNIKIKIDSLFENLIVHDNHIFNTYIFNHITWKEHDDTEFHQKTLDIIIKHFMSYLKKKLYIFRDFNKKNKFTLSSLNEFFDSFYKLLMRVNNTIIHFSKNNYMTPDTKKWGSSYIIDRTIQNLCSIVLNDVIIQCAIQKSITSSMMDERNESMYQFMRKVEVFSSYVNKHFPEMITRIVDETLVKNIPLINYNIPQNMLDIYRFKSLYQYFVECNNKYYYVNKTNINRFVQLLECISKQLTHIINIYDINFLQYFIREYRYEIISIANYCDTFYLLLSKNVQTLDNMINYYGSLYDITMKNEKLIPIVEIAIDNKVILIESDEMVDELIELIHCDIINGTTNRFLYIIARSLKNRDIFVSLLCNKLIYRIVYNITDVDIEKNHSDILNSLFHKKDLYQYNIIMNDYMKSLCFTNGIHTIDDSMWKKLQLIITSLDVWRLNHKTGHIRSISNCHGVFSHNISKLLRHYETIEQNRKVLVLYPHIGTIDITINNPIPSNVILTPAQMFCLELFENNTIVYNRKVLFEKLKNTLSQYSDRFILNIIKSLLEGGILIELDSDIITLNDTMPRSINIITIFNNINNTAVDIMKETLIELAHTRNDIIMTNIMSIVKKHSEKQNYNTVYKECKESIKLFDVSNELYLIALKTMCEKKYIALNENCLEKVLWI